MSAVKNKKVSQPIYLTEEQKEYIKKKSASLGITMNAYIVNLINREIGKK